MSEYITNNKIYYVVEHGALTTGLANSAFTKQAYKNGVADAATIAVSELSGGLYLITFTPSAAGQWHSDVYETVTPGTRYEKSFNVGAHSTGTITNETISTSITTAQNTVIAAIDTQQLNEIRRLAHAILNRLDTI